MRQLLTILLLVLTFCEATGQNSYTLDTYISAVLENDFGIKLMKNEVLISENENNPGAAGYLPTIGVTAEQNWTINSARQEFLSGQVNEASNAKNQAFTAGVMLNWTFFDGFRMFATDKKLDLLEEQTKLNLAAEMEMKIYSATLSYYTYLVLSEMKKVYEQSVDLSHARRELLELRVEKGATSEMELIQARLDVTADSAVLLDNMRATEQLRAEMNKLLGRSPEVELQLEGELPETIKQLTWEQLTEAVLTQNTTLLLAKSGIAVREKERKEALSRYYPQLAFYGAYNFGTSQNEVGFLLSNRSYGPQFGLTLRWDILDGLTRMKDTKNARIRVESAGIVAEQQELAVKTELHIAFQDYEWAVRMMEFEQRNAMEAEEMADIMEKSLQSGALTPLELREIQFGITLARSRLLNAQLNYLTSTLNISLASGDFKNLLTD